MRCLSLPFVCPFLARLRETGKHKQLGLRNQFTVEAGELLTEVRLGFVQVGIWKSQSGIEQPVRLKARELGLERRLQDWIADDPSIVEEGLEVIGTEIILDAKRRVDVLALDPNGRLVVIELKAIKLTRDVVAQTLDYVVTLQQMPRAELERVLSQAASSGSAFFAANRAVPEEALDPSSREVAGIAVGIGERADLTRIAEYLSRYEVPIRHLSFELFESGQDLLLVRHIEPAAAHAAAVSTSALGPRLEGLRQFVKLAPVAPFRSDVERLTAVATGLGLHTRFYVHSVMFSPAERKTRMLFTLSSEVSGSKIYVSPDAFAEFYGTARDDVTELTGELGARDERPLDSDFLGRLAEQLPRLMSGPES